MGLHEREKQLTFLYSAGGCLSLITIICSAVPWNHWEEILDRCLSVNCGCILYGKQTFNSFDGGDISACYFTTLASVPAFIIAVIMAVYHGYRVSMFSKEADNTTGRTTQRHRFVFSLWEQPSQRKFLVRVIIMIRVLKPQNSISTFFCPVTSISYICFYTPPITEHNVVDATVAILDCNAVWIHR